MHWNVKTFVAGRLGTSRGNEVDSVVNETFHQAFRNANKFSREKPVLAWIFGIAKVLMKGCDDRRRGLAEVNGPANAGGSDDEPDDGADGPGKGAEGDKHQSDFHTDVNELPADGGRTPEDIVSVWKDLEALDSCMKKLSAVQREAIELVYIHCLTQREVAEIQGVSRDAVAQRAIYARENLKSCIQKRHGILR